MKIKLDLRINNADSHETDTRSIEVEIRLASALVV